MQFYKCALLCAVLALSILEPITARKGYSGGGGRHSYPKSPGLSGGGGGSHGYPSSSGLSGGGGRGYPSNQGGSHNYPASTGLSGNTGNRGNQPSGGSHAYPGTGSNHGYPSSNGMSGNSNNRGSGSTTNIHHHYHYNPPQTITYTPTRGAPAVSYPVYRGSPPTYVYQYKDSGSKYGTLLAGLALLNLGTLAAGTAYAVSHSHNQGSSGTNYKPQRGELCKFGLRKDNGDYEETRIDCQLISSFILAEEAKTQGAAQQNSTSITQTVTVVNTTSTNNNGPIEQTPAANQTTKVLYEMRPDGSLVPVNITVNATTDASPTAPNTNNSMTSTVTVTNTTVTNAVDVKGKPVEVTAGMQCYVIRTTPISNMKKNVPCKLLQTYADQSLKSSAIRSLPTFTMITAVLAAFIVM